MTFTQKSIVTLFALLLPTSVLAVGAPANVRGIRVNNTNGAITVTWQAIKENTAFYRIYYSHSSILGNQGNYDDFERTQGPETTYTFAKAPMTNGTLFVSVLAVNSDGVESEGFEEEASIELNTPAPITPTTTPAVTTNSPMTITSVGPISSTGILVTFSEDVALTDVSAMNGYFIVTDTGGTLLSTTRINVVASTVMIHTAPQIPGKTYILMFTNIIPGVKGGSIGLTTAPAKFLGFSDSISSDDMPALQDVVTTPPAPTPAVPPVYVRNPYVPPPVAPVIGAIVTPDPVKKETLPDSGVPLLGLLGIAGAGAIVRLRRKKIA